MLITEPYPHQLAYWPEAGRHILAQYDAESVFVYQAYRPSIGAYAISHGYFGGEFSYTRMSWIKTNFLWMMYRSGWGTKPGQELTLAIRLRRQFFDQLLSQAVESSFPGAPFTSFEDWHQALKHSVVRLQWDPDHSPSGTDLARRALQLGLRGRLLKDYAKREILEILDISPFVQEQRMNRSADRRQDLLIPRERVYLPEDTDLRIRLRLDEFYG
jgi:Domain of unknown function (DUF4291)